MKIRSFQAFLAGLLMVCLPGALQCVNADGNLEFHGFGEYRSGMRMESDFFEEDITLNELRLQSDLMWYRDVFTV